MQLFEQKSFANLNKLASLVRGKLSKLARGVLCALITIDVHARDMVSEMVKNQVRSSDNFEWQKQLRYYWDPEKDDCIVRMSSSIYNYGYEYQGCSPRLVITPLTVSIFSSCLVKLFIWCLLKKFVFIYYSMYNIEAEAWKLELVLNFRPTGP